MVRSDSGLIWKAGLVREGPSGPYLEFSAVDACARCAAGGGCGAGLFSGLLLFSQPARLPIPGHAGYRPGQQVRAGIRPGRLVVAALLLYLVPVAAFVSGVLVADAVRPGSDGWALTGGLLACVMLWLPVIALLRRWPVQVDRIAVCQDFPGPGGEPGQHPG